jgi:hypothetical protein
MRDLKPDAGTCTFPELRKLFADVKAKPPEEIQFPYTEKLSARHTLNVERRKSQRLTDKGLVDLYNWTITENMVADLRRE